MRNGRLRAVVFVPGLGAVHAFLEWPLVIDREQVLHVARLARLELSDAEVETMAGELSAVLGHVDTISSLDLSDVEPTTHVIALENVLRPDEPWASLPREKALENAPDPADGAFRVPSPGS